MVIKFNCTCGQPLQVNGELAGKKARCPFCYKVLSVPTAGETPEARPPEPDKPQAPENVQTAAPAPAAAPPSAPATPAQPRASALPYIIIVVLALGLLATAALWWYSMQPVGVVPAPTAPAQQPTAPIIEQPQPVEQPQPPATIEQPSTKPPAPKPRPKAPAAKPAPPPAVTQPTPVAPAPVTPSTVRPPEPPKVEQPTHPFSFEPGQTIDPKIGNNIKAIVVALVRPLINPATEITKGIPKGTALKASVNGSRYEGVTFQDFNVYGAKDGTISVKRFHVQTTSEWKLGDGTVIPSGTRLQLDETNTYSVVGPEEPAAPVPAPPTAPAPQTPPIEELPPS